MDKRLILPMYSDSEPHLYVAFTGQLIYLQEEYLADIDGIAEVSIMGGLIFFLKPKRKKICTIITLIKGLRLAYLYGPIHPAYRAASSRLIPTLGLAD